MNHSDNVYETVAGDVGCQLNDSDALVTVVVPAYKAEAYLADCIRSVLAQGETRWRLVVVDDGSPDRSREIAEEFARDDSRIVVTTRKNGGMSAARNTGLKFAAGTPFVTFLDADDVLHPDTLSTLLSIQEGRSDRISCVSYFRMAASDSLGAADYGGSLRFFSGYAGQLPERPSVMRMKPKTAVENILYQRILDNCVGGKLYPSGMVPPGVFTEGIGYEDLDVFYRIFLNAGEVAYAPLKLYGYRRNPESFTSIFTEKRADVLDVAERTVAFMEKDYPELAPAARSRLLSASFNIFMLSCRNDALRYSALISRCEKEIKRLRGAALLDSRVRLKNRLGILVSYLGGLSLMRFVSRLHSRLR